MEQKWCDTAAAAALHRASATSTPHVEGVGFGRIPDRLAFDPAAHQSQFQ
jgi:hypothetical protein